MSQVERKTGLSWLWHKLGIPVISRPQFSQKSEFQCVQYPFHVSGEHGFLSRHYTLEMGLMR